MRGAARRAEPSCYVVWWANAWASSIINLMRYLYIIVPLLAILAASLWFAGIAWERLGGEAIPLYGWLAMAGGVFFSLLVGGGLMALVFYSNRHGYDEFGERNNAEGD